MIQAQVVHQDLKAKMVVLEILDHKVCAVAKVQMDLRVRKVSVAIRATKAKMANVGAKGPWAILALVHKVHKDFKVFKVHLVVPKGCKAYLAILAVLVPKDALGSMDLKVRKVFVDIKAMMAYRDQGDALAIQGLKVAMGRRAAKAIWVRRDAVDNKDQKDCLV